MSKLIENLLSCFFSIGENWHHFGDVEKSSGKKNLGLCNRTWRQEKEV